MDHLLTRLDALEQQVQTLTQHTRTATRRLRWWRGLACSLAVLGLLGWGLPLGLAREEAPDQEKGEKGLAHRVAALERLLKHVSREGDEITITGANLHIVNGLGRTNCTDDQGNPIPDCPNGLGNLIVGYNESRGSEDVRTGSHNVVVGQRHNFSRFGGLVVGDVNTISGDFASVSGGAGNTASGFASAISGGGLTNTASGDLAAVSGGVNNMASGFVSSVSGGFSNTVSGGSGNTASGDQSSVSGGFNRTAEGQFDWVAGSLVEDD
jgi:hypothetical protein